MQDTFVPFVTLFADGDTIQIFNPWQASDKPFTLPKESIIPLDPQQIPQGRLFWMLEAGIDTNIENLPWQKYYLFDKKFYQSAVLVKKACAAFELDSAPKKIYWNDVFPRDEHDFTARFEDEIKQQQLQRWQKSSQRQQTELIIVAHGDEQGLQNTELPEYLPPVVWLVACNINQAMDKLACQLLEKGCKTIVIADGKLEAEEMESIIRQRLQKRQQPLDSFIRQLPHKSTMKSANWQIYGQVNLGEQHFADYYQQLWDKAHNKDKEICLETWISTQAGYNRLREMELSGKLWHSSRHAEEIDALLLAGDEHWDHQQMEKRLAVLIKTENKVNSLIKALRRLGKYRLCGKILSDLNQQKNSDPKERYQLHKNSAQIWLDLDLPQAAENEIKQGKKILNNQLNDFDFIYNEEHKLLDIRARIKMRQYQWQTALNLINRKRKNSEHPQREITTLLTFSAWLSLRGETIDEAEKNYRDLVALTEYQKEQFQGNDNDLYSIKALIEYQIATNNLDTRLLNAIKKGLDHTDPGPAAMTILLTAWKYPDMVQQDLDSAITLLEEKFYYLELFVLLALLAEDTKGKEKFEFFKQLRNRTLECFSENSHLREEAEQRQSIENRLFEQPKAQRIEWIINNGLIPL